VRCNGIVGAKLGFFTAIDADQCDVFLFENFGCGLKFWFEVLTWIASKERLPSNAKQV
jgi:hypothetical protein